MTAHASAALAQVSNNRQHTLPSASQAPNYPDHQLTNDPTHCSCLSGALHNRDMFWHCGWPQPARTGNSLLSQWHMCDPSVWGSFSELHSAASKPYTWGGVSGAKPSRSSISSRILLLPREMVSLAEPLLPVPLQQSET